MLISIAMMFLVGMSMGWICKKIHLPSLFGMIVTGIVLGPYVLDVIDASILNISSDLRRIALIIILMRAGLSLDLNDLKKVGRPAVLMCFVPACFEIGGMVLLAPKLLGISILDAAIMGTVIAAVSPAVIVPKMLKLMEEGYGVKNVYGIYRISAGRSSFGSGLYQYSDFDCSRSFSRISYRISLCRIF